MASSWNILIDLQFAGRLKNDSGYRRAELLVLVENLTDFGLETLRLDGYCTVTRVRLGGGAIARIDFEFKSRGGWSPLFLEVKQPHVAVLYDR